MTKRRILLKAEIFVLIFAVLLSSVTYVMKKKAVVSSILKESDSFDVLFFGTSHVYNGIFPPELYNNYGITSLNCSTPTQMFALTYECIREAVKIQKPRLLIVDLYYAGGNIFERNWISESPWAHKVTDNMPFMPRFRVAENYLKYRGDTFQNFYEVMFPIYLYHSRWNEISLNDYKRISAVQKGASPLLGSENVKHYVNSLTDKRKPLSQSRKEELFNIVTLCENEKINLLFTVIPYGEVKSEHCQHYNEIKWLVNNKKYVKYLDMFYNIDEIKLDFSADMANVSHVNLHGAQKITAHLGKYIKEHYDIPDRRLDPAYAKWNEDYKLYVQDIFARELNSLKDSAQYVQFIASKKEVLSNICIFIVKNSARGGGTKPLPFDLNANGNNYIAVVDNGKIAFQRSAADVPLMYEYKVKNVPPVKLISNANGKSSIKVDGIEQVNDKTGMTIVIYDKLLKKVTNVRNL